MRQEEVEVIVAVPVAAEDSGNLILVVGGVVSLRVQNVFVAGDTAALGGFLVVCGEHGVHAVLVAQIRAIEGSTEVGCRLVGVVATCISIVQVEANTDTFAGIDGKLCLQVVLTVGLVTAVVVGNIGDGRQCVGVVQLVGGTVDKAVALDEGKLLGFRTVNVNTVQTGCIVATSGIELSILARI